MVPLKDSCNLDLWREGEGKESHTSQNLRCEEHLSDHIAYCHKMPELEGTLATNILTPTSPAFLQDPERENYLCFDKEQSGVHRRCV